MSKELLKKHEIITYFFYSLRNVIGDIKLSEFESFF